MARIVEQSILVKVSRIVRNDEQDLPPPPSTEVLNALEMVAQEMSGDDAVVEVALLSRDD